MFLESILLLNFKNYSNQEVRFSSKITCVVGKNGMGKTNLLDAVHYSCLTRSYFGSVERHNVNTESDFFSIKVKGQIDSKNVEVFSNYPLGQKKTIKWNQKPYDRVVDHIGKMPCVMVTPGDLYLITEYSEERRKFVDSILSQFDSVYLVNLSQYQKVLQQRNALLKSTGFKGKLDLNLLQIYDDQLAQYGAYLHERRKAFMEEFLPEVQEIYESISGGNEKIHAEYKSQLNETKLIDLLAMNLEKDRITERTNYGIHKDDYAFFMNDMSIKKYGSQGQQKSFIFSLKLAQARLIAKHSGKLPVLLLDDIFDRLDNQRIENLMKMIASENIGHLFISDTDGERVEAVLDNISCNFEMFLVHEGEVKKY